MLLSNLVPLPGPIEMEASGQVSLVYGDYSRRSVVGFGGLMTPKMHPNCIKAP